MTIETNGESIAIYGDIRAVYGEMIKEAQNLAYQKYKTTKFKLILIDPPWKGTGFALGYDLLDDNEWMDIIKISEIMDDGIVFLWVTKMIGKRSFSSRFCDKSADDLENLHESGKFNKSHN